MKAILALEDGTQFVGESFGATGSCLGETVFNTGMTGYEEALTDPSFAGQIVTMTYPLMGNYGLNSEDKESDRIHLKGFVIRELSEQPSNFRAKETLHQYLARNNIIGIKGIDTRALTRILREKGTMNGVISTEPDFKFEDWIQKLKDHKFENPVEKVTTKKILHYEGTGKRIAVIDYGVKHNIIRCLQKRDCEVYVFPAASTADDIMAVYPDGILLSNGPGNPKDCGSQTEVIKQLMGRKPIFGICLGHLLAAIANGAETFKLKYGHRGGNHPVRDMERDRIYIISQGHGYAVLADSLNSEKAIVSHINVNDGTVEGIKYLDSPTFTVQFHPEGAPGPNDTEYLFDTFISLCNR
jgi:carbamoyl-phosphate synthase small subunit